jgi:hypothetical protein
MSNDEKGDGLDFPFGGKVVEATIHTTDEVAKFLREGPVAFTSEKSRVMLAQWLEELLRARRAIYEAQCGLAKARSHE